MKPSLARSVKTLLTMVLSVIALSALSQGVARADQLELTVTGYFNGCMCPTPTNQPPDPNNPVFSPLGLGLNFRSELFSETSVNGNITAISFGSLSLDPDIDLSLLNNQTFTLELTFMQPLGVNGDRLSRTFTGRISVSPDGLDISFLNPTRTFTFSNSFSYGLFDITLSDVFIERGSTGAVPISGGILNIENNPVPEPATLILLATGLAGAAGAARRRLKRGPQ